MSLYFWTFSKYTTNSLNFIYLSLSLPHKLWEVVMYHVSLYDLTYILYRNLDTKNIADKKRHQKYLIFF